MNHVTWSVSHDFSWLTRRVGGDIPCIRVLSSRATDVGTKLISVNDVGNDEQVVAQTVCQQITFGEDEAVVNFPTVSWLYKSPTSTDYITRSPGSRQVFSKPKGSFYQPGELVAYVKVAVGSSTFAQEES